jgi:hypothetical protein
MPMLEGASRYFSKGKKDNADVAGRPSVSLWDELMR